MSPCPDYLGTLAKAALPAVGLLMVIPQPAWADPPPWAPAHGWRAKQGNRYVGYTGTTWDRDYGVIGGRCDRQAIGAAAGAVVGGVLGSQVGRGDGKAVATVLGAVIGSVVGAKIAAEVDDGDRACIGQSLELAASNAAIVWVNPATRVSYTLTPLGGYKQDGRICREFTLRASAGSNRGDGRGYACQMRDGTWQLAQKEGSKSEARRDDDEHGAKGKGKGRNR